MSIPAQKVPAIIYPAEGLIANDRQGATAKRSPLLKTLIQHRVSLFLLFLIGEGVAFATIPASTALDPETMLTAQAAVTGSLLLIALLARSTATTRVFQPVLSAFFVGALALLVSLLLGDNLQQWLSYSLNDASGVALAKLSQSMLRVMPILLLLGLTAKGRESLYLVRGRLGLGLPVGTAAFIAFGALAFAPLVDNEPALRNAVSSTPWLLLFIFANALEEELLFRGLFLKRYEPFLGKGLSILATAIVFTLVHVQVTYTADLVQFLAIVFPLGLALAYLMQKSNSLWGSVLFHAGADLLLIVPFFAIL